LPYSIFEQAGNLGLLTSWILTRSGIVMAKPHRTAKKANHGKRPANAKARKAKRRKVRT
jgi:hypothetical protein